MGFLLTFLAVVMFFMIVIVIMFLIEEFDWSGYLVGFLGMCLLLTWLIYPIQL